jgi:hypothetical protein
MRTEGERKFFTAKEAAATLSVKTDRVMELVRAHELSFIDRRTFVGAAPVQPCGELTEDVVEFEQGDFDKFNERKAEQALLSEILIRGPSGAKEWALLRRHEEQATNRSRHSFRHKGHQP